MLDVETLGAALKLAKKGGGGGGEGGSGAVIDDSKISSSTTWSSQKIVDTLCPPFTTSGAIVQCTPVANYPLSVQASWGPRQEGSGDPSPDNIRPITGVDSVQVTRCGKNLWSYTLNSSGRTWIIPFVPKGTYTLSALSNADWWTENSNFNKWYLRSEDGSQLVSTVYFNNTIINQRCYATVEIPYSGAFALNTYSEQTVASVQDMQIEVGSIATAYEPYAGTTATLTPPETIYGGTVDVVTGVGSAQYIYRELAISDMDNSEDFPGWRNVPWINDVKHRPASDGDFATLGIYGATNIAGISQGMFWNSHGTQVYTLPESWGGKNQSQIKEAYPNLVVQFCLQLVTPTPFQATGNAPIPALPGTNTVYTDAGNITVTGASDPIATITALQNRVSALESTALN